MSQIIIPESEIRCLDLQISSERRSGSKSRKIQIRAAVFGKMSKKLDWGFYEQIQQGAFDGADMTDVVAVFNHNQDLLLARTLSGTLKLSIDKEGLKGEFEAPDTKAGNDLLVLVERGDVRKASFSFIVDKDRWSLDYVGNDIRTIEKFKRIIDISPVVFEAYPDTSVAKRRFDEYRKTIPSGVLQAEREFRKLRFKHD